MRVIVQSKSVAVTEALRRYIRRQLSLLTRHSQRISSVTVILETIKGGKDPERAMKVKICIHLPKAPFCVEREGHDLYQVVVDASHRAARYLRKTKEKHLESRRRVEITPWSLGLG